ncbi:hypothetical protein BH11BAC5_BH11BAC5_34970 [soil metagenome]
MENFKLVKTFFKAQTFAEAEKDKLFKQDVSIGKRLSEAWWLTCTAYKIDPANPPKMDKQFFCARKHSC